MKLVLSSLSVAYAKSQILQGVTTEVKAGEFIGLVGPNGSGKSCLLKTIAGLLSPMAGKIHLNDQNLHNLSAKHRARQVSYLAQDKATNWPLPVYDLVALGRAPYRGHLGKLSAEGLQAIEKALHSAHCNDLRNRRFDQLSGGEQMRVHLARTLAVDAPFILADEPNTALDPYYQISLMNTLADQVNAGKTVIASLHDLSLAKQFCSRIWVLHHGALKQDEASQTALGDDIFADVFKIRQQGHGWETTNTKQKWLNPWLQKLQTPKKN